MSRPAAKRTANRKAPRKSIKDNSGIQEQGRRSRQDAADKKRKGKKSAALAERRHNDTAANVRSLSLDGYPHYAFVKWSEFNGIDVNKIGGSFQGNWKFDLVPSLESIRAKCPGHNIYMVGFRNEERVPLGSDGRVRTMIPFFAAHCLPRESSPPDSIAFRTLGDHDAVDQFYTLSELAWKWEKFGQCPTGENIMMLKSSSRKTIRSAQTQPAVSSGGSVWFPGRKGFKYLQNNPFHAMKIAADLVFMDGTWDLVKAAAKQELDEGVTLRDILNCGSLQVWEELFLSKAVTEFMEYYEDEIESISETDVMNALLEAMTHYHKARQEAFNEYTKCAQGLQDVVHFKIYPSNDFLTEYLSKGSLNNISPYAVASEVYPQVESAKSDNSTDLWGN